MLWYSNLSGIMDAETISKNEASSRNRVKYSLLGLLFCGLLFTPLMMHAQTYAPADVAVINALIANNGLKATPSDPASWSFAIWNNATPRQITELKLNHSNLSGAASFSGLSQLKALFCDNNNLTELDVTNCSQLVRLWCYDNNLSKLDVTKNTQLTSLLCHHNSISELDVTKNTQLEILRCDKNVLIANNNLNANLIVTKNTNPKIVNTRVSARQNDEVTSGIPIAANASDIIMLKNGQEIKAKVVEITLTEIKYKLFEHLDGPTRTAAKNDVFVIIYENGTREVISPSTANTRTARQGDKFIEDQYKFRFYIGTGIGASYGFIGPSLEARFNPVAVHAGIGVIKIDDIRLWSLGAKWYFWKNLYGGAVVGSAGAQYEFTYNSVTQRFEKTSSSTIIGLTPMFGVNWSWGGNVRFGVNAGVGYRVAFGNIDNGVAYDAGINISFGKR